MQKILPLAEQLKRQAEQDNEIILEETRKQFETMRAGLNSTLQRELNTIENDIGGLNKHLAWRLFKSRIIWPGMAGIALCLGILGGSWALTQFFTSKIHSQTATVEKLRQTETELQARIADMEQRAGRIVLTKCDGRMCVQIDPKADGYTGRNGEEYRVLWGY